MARRKVGRTRIRLASMLSKALSAKAGEEIVVDPENIWMQEGAYRSHYWDLARWGATVYWPDTGNVRYMVSSWSRMTDLVREGQIQFVLDEGTHLEVS